MPQETCLIPRAKRLARKIGESLYVIETDEGDARTQGIVREDYIRSDEFVAFDGEIIAIVSPDGWVEW